MASKHVFREPLEGFTKIEKFDLVAVGLRDVVDPFDHLCVLYPAVRVKHEIENTLLEHGGIDCGFPVFDGDGIVVAVEVLCLPVAWHHARHLPNAAADGVRVRVVFDRNDIGIKRDILFKLGFAVGIGEKRGRERLVLRGENVEHRGVHLQKLSGGVVSHQQLGKDTWTGGVLRITTGRAKGDRKVIFDIIQQIDATVVGVFRRDKIPSAKDGAGMAEGVDLNCNAFLQPLLQVWLGRGDRVAKNTNRCAAVDFFEAFEDRAAVALVPAVLAHVVDSQRDHCLHAFLTHPLWRGELREIEAYVERVFSIEIGQAVGGGLG